MNVFDCDMNLNGNHGVILVKGNDEEKYLVIDNLCNGISIAKIIWNNDK